MDTKKVEALQQLVDKARRIVFFGGAGVSTESGIPDFRSVDGLYNQKYDYPPEEILSHTFFVRHPEEFFRFYRDKLLPLDARPNKAHLKLAQWEQEGKMAGVVTQNIDGLHQAAGSRKGLRASRQRSSELLHEVRPFLPSGIYPGFGGSCSSLPLRRQNQARCGAL